MGKKHNVIHVCVVGLILLFTAFAVSSCNAYHVPTGETTGNEYNVSTGGSACTTDIIASSAEEVPITMNETIIGIPIAEYPDPYIVSEYEVLTEEQKIAYDMIGLAMKDILDNGPVAGKLYSFPQSMDWYDYKVAFNLFWANFKAVEDLVVNLFDTHNQGNENSVDGIFLFDDGNLDTYYQKYLEISQEADEILSELEHDGTEYGKVLAVAKWMVDNIVYPSTYTLEEYLNSAYTALIHKKAVCDGYAKAFDFLCKKAGLESIYVTSWEPGRGHAWNMIHMGENWYHVDVTWMGSGEFYKYFMMSDDICASTGHDKAEYYWNQKENIKIIPSAQSNKYYSYSASEGIPNN